MRFHIGFSKRLSFRSILKWGLIIASIFSINSCVVHAASFETIQNYSNCEFGTSSFNNSNCSVYNASVFTKKTLNGISNALVPEGAYTSDDNNRLNERKTEIFKFGGVSDCVSGNTISLYVDAIMGGYDGSFSDNVLDPSQFVNPTLNSSYPILGATCPNTWCTYWPWLSNDYSSSDNKVGVKIAKSDGTSSNNCTFVSYGNNKSVRFLCQVASGNTGYQILLNEVNNNFTRVMASGYPLRSSVAIKTSVLSDPCVQYESDQSGVIDAIGDQTSDIMDGINGIIDNQNQNTEEIKDAIGGIGDKLDETNDSLDSIDENTTSCKTDFFDKNNNPYNSNVGYLSASNTILVNTSYRYTDYLRLGTKNNLLINGFSYNSSVAFCLYDISKNLISCTPYGSVRQFNISSDAKYIRFSYDVLSSNQIITLKRCSGIGDTLIDSDVNVNLNSYFSSINTLQNNTVAGLIQMPITMASKIYNAVSITQCSSYPINLQLPGTNNNVDLSLPCIDYQEKLGTNLANLVDGIFSIAIFYGIAMLVIKFFEDWTSLQDTWDQQYKGGSS